MLFDGDSYKHIHTHTHTTKIRYGLLKAEKLDERFRILALRDGRVVSLYVVFDRITFSCDLS